MMCKYPRTYHLPWSLGASSDDKILPKVKHLEGKDVVITEKKDGENTTIYSVGYCHARSLSSVNHPSRAWVKALAAQVGMDIPEGWRVCGENLYARHSIYYENLSTYFMVFGIYDADNRCLSWDETVEWCGLLGLTPVPVLYRGPFLSKDIQNLHKGMDLTKQEGYVVRVTESFDYNDFDVSVAKFVRQGHVVENAVHWATAKVIPNKLQDL